MLREAFDHPYRQISDVLAVSEENARQLANRARLRLAGERRRQANAPEQQRFIDAFVDVAQTGDLAPLEQLLADQSPNQRARLTAPNSSFSAANSRDGSWRWAAAAGPLRKFTSTLLTSPSPNSA